MTLLASPRAKLIAATAALGTLALLAPGHASSPALIARVVLVLSAGGVGLFWLHRKGTAPGLRLEPRMTIAAKVSLSPRCSVALVDADDRTFVIAYGEGFAQITLAPRRRARRLADDAPVFAQEAHP